MGRDYDICKVLINRGTWTKARCELCRRLHKEKCDILNEQAQREKDNQPVHPDNR